MKLVLNGKTMQETKIEIAANSQTNFTFTYPEHRDAQEPLRPGEYQLEVRVEDHGLEIDNARWFVLPVREQIRVLLINGKPLAEIRENPAFFLKKALAASRSSEERIAYIVPEERAEQEFSKLDLNRFDCVFLCNIAGFSHSEVEKLRTYLDSGGGVVFVLGDRVKPDLYNEKLCESGREILPAKIANLAQTEADGSRIYEFETLNLSHSIVNLFAGNPGSGLESVFTFQYFKTELAEDSLSKIVLQFKKSDTNPGDPVIVEKSVGRGHSLLMTTSLDASWSTWSSTSPSFLPIVQELVHFAVRGRWRNVRFQVGDTIPLWQNGLGQPTHNSNRIRKPDGSVQAIFAQSSADWKIERDGCDYFREKPRANSMSVGRFAAGTIVRVIKEEQGFLEIEKRGERFWVESKFLKRQGSSRMYFQKTMQSGIYELLPLSPLESSKNYAVNLDVQESDLTHISQDKLQKEAFPGIEFHYRKRWKPLESKLHNISTEENPVAQLLLGIALSLLFVDLVMAWRFFYGLVFLGVLFSVWLIGIAFYASILWGIGTSSVICVLVLFGVRFWRRRVRTN